MTAMAGLDDIDGFISLAYFRSTPVTVDYTYDLANSRMILAFPG
jgi:hypothetical protein